MEGHLAYAEGREVNADLRWDVLGLGIAAVDDLLYVDAYPQPDTKVAVRARQRQGGGLTATALVAAARMGATAAYAGVLGNDELSRYTVDELEREGVDCSPVLRQAEAAPCHSVIIVDRTTGSRTILYSWDHVLPLRPDEVTGDLIRRCRVLLVDHSMGHGGLHALEVAHDLGIQTVGDVERLDMPGAAELMREVDHLIVGIKFAVQVTGETRPETAVRALRALRGPGVACCVVTAGEQGCWYTERDSEVQHVAAPRVPVVDTTGCGDVFHGAYAACLAQGKGVARAIEIATAAAALKAQVPGGRAGIPNRAAVKRFLQKH